jgi:hypothetical protein
MLILQKRKKRSPDEPSGLRPTELAAWQESFEPTASLSHTNNLNQLGSLYSIQVEQGELRLPTFLFSVTKKMTLPFATHDLTEKPWFFSPCTSIYLLARSRRCCCYERGRRTDSPHVARAGSHAQHREVGNESVETYSGRGARKETELKVLRSRSGEDVAYPHTIRRFIIIFSRARWTNGTGEGLIITTLLY